MTDFIDMPQPAPSPPPPPPDNPDRPVCTPAEIADGKALAIISYALNFIAIPFFLVPLIMRSDRFSLYHAKQCLILWLTAIIGGIAWKIAVIVIGILTCGIGFIIAIPLTILLVVGLWVLNIMGLINAVNGRCVPHWLIGGWGEKWFAGIRVEPKPGRRAVSARYTVELLDGQTFGPADADTLRVWATEGRIPPVAMVRADDGTVCRAIDCGPIKDIMAKVAAAPPMGAGALPAADDPAVSVVIPYKNVHALVGYYTSIGSLICVVGLIAGPAALWLGIKGLRNVKANPKVHGTAHAWIAIILGGLTTLANWGAVVLWAIGSAVH